MKVPKNMTIGIGNKEYKSGEELPADYELPSKKRKADSNFASVKTEKTDKE
jgi:hypothetical protein